MEFDNKQIAIFCASLCASGKTFNPSASDVVRDADTLYDWLKEKEKKEKEAD